MATVDLKSVYRVVSRGHVYYYAWKGRGAPRLYAQPGSDEFVEELQAALAGRKLGDGTKISGLCARYKASPEWTGLAESTRKNWVRWLDRIQEHFGVLSIRQFDRPMIRLEIRRWRDKYRETPRAADMALQVLSRLMSFAVENGLLSVNPCSGISTIYRNDRSDLIWSDAQLAAVYAKASPELAWAARLAMATGLREGDLLKLSWSHVKPFAIEMSTGKSRGRRAALIPMHPELKSLLAEVPKRATTILTNTRGKPWRSGFSDSWRDACARAKVEELHFHDLRGTAATKLYLADFTTREIAEMLAWSEERVERLIDRYVKRDELLKARIRKIEKASSSGR